MKQKGIAPILIILILIAVGIGGFAAYKSYYAPKSVTPVVTPVAPTAADETVNWKTYTNSADNFSFKYPPNWTIDTTGEKGDERGENIQIKLTKGNAQIRLNANMVGIGGVGGNYEGTPVNFAGTSLYRYKVIGADNMTVIVGLTDQLTESLGVFQINQKTYSFTLEYPKVYTQTQASILEKDFDLILSTFKFTK